MAGGRHPLAVAGQGHLHDQIAVALERHLLLAGRHRPELDRAFGRIAMDVRKELRSITLPDEPHIELYALTLVPGPPPR